MSQKNKIYGPKEIVALIRRYVYGLDYQDEEWNCIVDNASFRVDNLLSLTAAYNEYLLSHQMANNRSDVFSTFPCLLAFAFALERGLLNGINISDEIDKMREGQLGDEFLKFIDPSPYEHFEYYARKMQEESKREIRWKSLISALAGSVLIFSVWALVELVQ